MVFGQADMGTVETATKLFGPMGGVCAVLVAALVYVFRLYHAETRARIEDVRAFADAQRAVNEQILPYVAKIMIGAITGSTNFAGLRELKSSRVVGAAGVGTVVIEAVGSDGAKDTDAAGAIRVIIFTPQS